jgi:hypothetical protein
METVLNIAFAVTRVILERAHLMQGRNFREPPDGTKAAARC